MFSLKYLLEMLYYKRAYLYTIVDSGITLYMYIIEIDVTEKTNQSSQSYNTITYNMQSYNSIIFQNIREHYINVFSCD